MSIISETEKPSAAAGEKVFEHFWRTRIFLFSGHADADHVQQDRDPDQGRRVAEESH
jgi:hypothetical protein